MGDTGYARTMTEDPDQKIPQEFENAFKEQEEICQNRGRWSGRWDFLMAALSYAVGLGNLWRFPYLVYRNGGGAFLIPYIIMNFAAGIPLFLLEMSIGQFSSSGAVNVWRLCPLFKGMGVAMVAVSGVVAPYYNMIIAWAMIFFCESFTWTLPWSTCDNDWNSANCSLLFEQTLKELRKNCTLSFPEAKFKKGSCIYKDPISGNMTSLEMMNVSLVGPADEYFHKGVLDMTEGLLDLGATRWQLSLALLGTWFLVFLVIMKGPQSSGKVAYFTAIFPYVVLFILLARGLTLEGCMKGVEYFIYPKWHKLLEPAVWGDAAVQVTYSLACGWGGILTLSSYKDFRSNILRETYFICGVTAATAILSGFVIFSVLGFMAEAVGLEVEDVAAQGAGLAFIVYPEAIAHMPISPLWSILFFLMIMTLGIGTQIAIVTTVVAAIVDSSPKLRRFPVTVAFCIVAFLLGLPLCTGGGMYILQLVDNYIAAWSVIIICIFETLIISYLYGMNRLMDDIQCMIGYRPSKVWMLLWGLVCPVTLLAILVSIFWKLSEGKGSKYGVYEYPKWADSLGLLVSFIPVMMIPMFAIFQMVQAEGDLIAKVRSLVKPASDWGPVSPFDRSQRLHMSPTTASNMPMLIHAQDTVDTKMAESLREKS